MKTYESSDSFTTQKGLVKVVYVPDPIEDNRPSLGEVVRIDGGEFRVKLVQPVLKIMDPPIPSNNHGLLVESLEMEASTDDD